MQLDFYPIANLFPLIEGQELVELVEDIREHGLRAPIVLFEGKILDGRNRYRACSLAGFNCPSTDYDGDDPVAYVVSVNVRRRHLNESQRAMVAANLTTLAHGGSRQGANLRLARSNAEAAELLNVSERSVDTARAVRDRGVEELQNKVASGALSVSTAAEIARLPAEEQEEITQLSEKEILERARQSRAAKAKERRAERLQKIEKISRGDTPLVSTRRYPVIYADPPWRYENPPMGDTNRSVENHYPTMSIEEICALPVGEIAAEDAILYLWSTSSMLANAMKVIEAWGFEYRANMVWVKDKIGMGYHVRNQHELLLIARRGEMPAPASGEQPSSVLHAPRAEHSAKPVEFHEVIERAYPDVGKLELFSRSTRSGWDVWGNESEGKVT